MTETAETGSIAKALAAFQAKMPTVAKASTATIPGKDGRQGYTYSYADLADVTEAAMPLLAAQGLSFSCCPRRSPQGDYDLVGILLHESGESIEGCLPIQGSRAQDIGSSITYGRRYLLGCMTGIVTDADDDGAAANGADSRVQRSRAISEAQLHLIGQLMKKLGMTDPELARQYVIDTIGRQVGSTKELTVNEGSALIESLKNDEKAGS